MWYEEARQPLTQLSVVVMVLPMFFSISFQFLPFSFFPYRPQYILAQKIIFFCRALPHASSLRPGTKGFAVENELLAGAHNPELSTAINSCNGVFTTQLLVIGFSKAIRGKGLSKNRPTCENAVA